MASETASRPSFSPGRKWSIAFDVVLRTVVVLAVVAMVNYLGSRYPYRRNLSSQTRLELSPRTFSILKSVTNEVKVTLYYDKEDGLYSSISALLNEYRAINSHITVQTADYIRDATTAQQVKSAYKLSSAADKSEKNVVIFDCQGRTKIVPGSALADYTLEEVNPKDREFRKKLVAFKGEMMFTSMLLGVTSPKPLNAYFLQGHGEHQVDSADEVSGYLKFAGILQQNYIRVATLSLLGTNPVPADCNLLIIAGPTTTIPDAELEKVEKYLEEGGRLLALFSPLERSRESGLERIVAHWGVSVDSGAVRDPDQSERGSDVVVSAFTRHPVVNPVLGSGIQLILPRPVRAAKPESREADAPKVEEVAFTGEHSFISGNPQQTGRFPVMAVVEKGAVRGVVTERGTTRILVVGDSMLFGNGRIEKWANRDFANCAVNWLLDRTQLLEGLGPKPVTELRINMTQAQLQNVEWILLAALPGAVLLLGVLVWAGRRK